MESSNFFNNLPLDLWTNHILSTLSVKNLLQFRSVCKLWRDTIDDPRFVSKHLTLSTNNVDKNQVLSIEKVGAREREPARRLLTVRNKNTLIKQSDLFQQPDIYHLKASCNGLFLVQPIIVHVDSYWRPLETSNPKLWNPSIRKSLNLPPCPLYRDSRLSNITVMIKYVFGFRPSRNDYVVFAFRVEPIMPMNISVAVYPLSDNLWNIKDYKLSLDPDKFFMLGHGEEIFCPDGVFHWFGRDQEGCYLDTHLISFDFEIETFSDIELPDVSLASKSQRPFRRLFVLGESLALFSISSEWSSIWVLKNKLWNLWFSGTKWFAGFNFLRKNPSMYHTHTRVFVENGGDISLVYGKTRYKIMSDEIQELNEPLNWSSLILDTYIESLVLHKGCQGQIIDSL